MMVNIFILPFLVLFACVHEDNALYSSGINGNHLGKLLFIHFSIFDVILDFFQGRTKTVKSKANLITRQSCGGTFFIFKLFC